MRPTSGGIVFGSAATSEIAGLGAGTLTVTDPEAATGWQTWVPVVTGIVIALVVHLTKALTRPMANTATAGTAAPVLSTGEDIVSAGLSLIAVFLPLVVVLAVIGLVVVAVVVRRRMRRRRDRRLRSGSV